MSRACLEIMVSRLNMAVPIYGLFPLLLVSHAHIGCTISQIGDFVIQTQIGKFSNVEFEGGC
jgi:hypothetical protein